MTTHEAYYKRKREKAEKRWFQVLAKKREGLKWREVAAFFGIDTAFAFRMAQQAIEIELSRKAMKGAE
jgi:hypothetical protein